MHVTMSRANWGIMALQTGNAVLLPDTFETKRDATLMGSLAVNQWGQSYTHWWPVRLNGAHNAPKKGKGA